MFIQKSIRYGVTLFLAAIASGCSLIAPETSSHRSGGECQWNRSSCMHEGSYEPGERDYAEEEAKRLNRAASARLGRRSGD